MLGLLAVACGDDKGTSAAGTSGTTGSASSTAGTGGSATASGTKPATTTTVAADPLAALGVDIKKDCPSDYKPDKA